MRIRLDLTESDLDFFRARLSEARQRFASASEQDILDGAASMAGAARETRFPLFVRDSLAKLKPLVAMLTDTEWKLEGADRQRVLDALMYFADPNDLIPDDLPGIGFVDDAIMIELVCATLAPELDAFADFIAHREELAAGNADIAPIEQAREVMQGRMRRRRSRAKAGGVWRHSTNFNRDKIQF